MKKTLKVFISISLLLTILNILFNYGIFPFVKHSIGSHNGEEAYLVILTGLIALIFLIKGGYSLYKKNYSTLNFSFIIVGLNLIIWFIVLNKVECVNCSII